MAETKTTLTIFRRGRALFVQDIELVEDDGLLRPVERVEIDPEDAFIFVTVTEGEDAPALHRHETTVDVTTRFHPSGDQYTWASASCEHCAWTAEGDESDVRGAASLHAASPGGNDV